MISTDLQTSYAIPASAGGGGTSGGGGAECPGNSGSVQFSSLPFVLFQLSMVALYIISGFVIRRMRRISELRTQQRYERLSRVDVGFGGDFSAARPRK